MEEREDRASARPELKDLVLLDAEDWVKLGLQLCLPFAKLRDIRRNYPQDVATCRMEMFDLWLRTCPSASYEELALAYHKLGETDMFDFIQQRHGKISSVSSAHATRHDALQQTYDPQHVRSQTALENIAAEYKKTYKRMSVLPSHDWPPSIGRHESNLVMIEHGRRKLPGAKEAQQMQRDYVGGNVDRIVAKKKEIGYDDIFGFNSDVDHSEDDIYESRHFKMLIDGAPGIGKSVLCRKFCKDWGTGKILQQFSMVWLLHLRDERIAKAKSIDDLFQHYNKKLQKELLIHIEETGGEGNALVCDGFDELSKQERTQHSLFLDIINGNLLPNCSVIVTSRPYASLELQQLESITHHVEIVGFTEEQIKDCIRRNITEEPKAEELIQKLKQRLDIFTMCYSPLNMSIVLYVYKQDECQLPTTLTQLYYLYVLHTLKRSVENHFKHLDADDITDFKCLPDLMQLPFNSLCQMAYSGLVDDQLGFSKSQLPQSLQDFPGCGGTNPELLGLMSGSKSFSSLGKNISYQFTHLTVQEFLAAWHAATGFSSKELSKFFLENMEDERFRMMILFLSGLTGMQDKQVYLEIVHKLIPRPLQLQQPVETPEGREKEKVEEEEEEGGEEGGRTREEVRKEDWKRKSDRKEKKEQIKSHLFFLAHLIYESQNACLSHILASSVELDGQLKLLHFIDLFQCTVISYFLSTCNYPWNYLELSAVTDQQVEVMQQVSCEIAGSSDERGERQSLYDEPPLLLHNDTQQLMVYYQFETNPPPKPMTFSGLLTMKQLTTLQVYIYPDSCVVDRSLGGVKQCRWKRFVSNHLFKSLGKNATLKKLEILISYSSSDVLDDDYEMGELLCDMLKMNSGLKHLILKNLQLTDLTAMHIAAGLVENHSLETLDVNSNRFTSVGASSIFKALETNNTLKSLEFYWAEFLCRLHSSQTPESKPLSTPQTQLKGPYSSPVHTPQVCIGSAIACMLCCNRALTDLRMSRCGLTSQCCVKIFKALQHNSSLKKLDIMESKLDSEGSEALADMLSRNNSLTKLFIIWCDPQPEALARGLLQNTSLTFLEVYHSDLKGAVMAALEQLRRQEGCTEESDPVMCRWEQVISCCYSDDSGSEYESD